MRLMSFALTESEQAIADLPPATKGEVAIVILLVLIFTAVLAGAKEIANAIRETRTDRR